MTQFSTSWKPYGSGAQCRLILDITTPPTVTSSTTSVAIAASLYLQTTHSLSDSVNLNQMSGDLGSHSQSTAVSHGSGGGTTLIESAPAITFSTSYTTAIRIDVAGSSQNYEALPDMLITGFVTIPVRPAGVPSQVAIPTASAITATTATLAWSAPANNGSAITGYTVQIDDVNTFVSPLVNVVQPQLSRALSGLTRFTTYYARVRAINGAGAGVYSAIRSFTTLSRPPSAPGTPTIVDGTLTSSTADFTWTAPTDTGGHAITSYTVQWAENSSFTGTLGTATETDLDVSLVGLLGASPYWIRVRANSSDGAGTWSAARAFTTLTGSRAKVAGTWRDTIGRTKVTGAWVPIRKVWMKIAGTWVEAQS